MPRKADRDIDSANVKSVQRTIEVLKLFGVTKAPMSAAMVQHRLAIPQSSTWMLLRTLTTLGYLAYDAKSRVYSPTLGVNLLGAWMQSAKLNGVDIEAMMQSLHYETGATVVLGMQSGIFVRYIHTIQNAHDIRFSFPIGVERPVWLAAAGKVLLTLQPEAEVAGLVRRINARSDVVRINSRQFLEEIAACRRAGYSINRGTATPGTGAVAMVVPTIEDGPPVSISLCGSMSLMNKQWDRVEQLMRGELLRLSQRFKSEKVSK